jgi:general secretion pathway protein H
MTLLKRRQNEQGFTLIEVLLVVVIVGILMGVTVISLNIQDPSRRLLLESERLTANIRFARMLAENDQREIGLELLPEAYRFLAFDNGQRLWLPIDNEPALKPVSTPSIAIRWIERPEDIDNPFASDDTSERTRLEPDLILLSSGEATPGQLQLRIIGDNRVPPRTLTVSDIGEVNDVELVRAP